MGDIVHIGKCKGCNNNAKLNDGVCENCLNAHLKGRKWAEMSEKFRQSPEFALKVYNEIGTSRPDREIAGKFLFIKMYGLPEGAVCPKQITELLECFPELTKKFPEMEKLVKNNKIFLRLVR